MKGKQHLQIEVPFRTTVRGLDASGDRFELTTVLDALSSADLLLRLARPVAMDTSLFVVVRLTLGETCAAPGIAFQGVVSNAEARSGGVWALSIRVKRHRFLYTNA